MKKGIYYYRKMKSREQGRFKYSVISENSKEEFQQILDTRYNSFEEFLRSSFDWSKSFHGKDYWALIIHQVNAERLIKKHNIILVILVIFFSLAFFVFSLN